MATHSLALYHTHIPKRLRLLGYARVSTREQVRGSESIDNQCDAMRRYVKDNGHTLLDIISEKEGESGRLSISKRRGLAEGIRRLDSQEPGGPQGLLFVRLDRLSRDLFHTIELAKRAERVPWKLVCVQEAVDYATPNGQLHLHMRLSIAQYESAQIGERVANGMATVRLRVGRNQSRCTPFGFRLATPDGPFLNAKRERDAQLRKIGRPDARRLVECPAEQRLLERILRGMGGCLPGQAEALAYRLAKQFRAEGIAHPRGYTWKAHSLVNIYNTAMRHRRQKSHYDGVREENTG